MNVAYNADCLEAMRKMPDNAYDLAIVDPPYGINICSQTVQVERERDGQGSAERNRLEIKTRIGGENLSRPKSITPSMIKKLQMPNIFRN